MKKLGAVLGVLFVIGLIGSIFEGDPQTSGSSNNVVSTEITSAPTLPPPPTTTLPPVSKKQFKAALAKTRIKKDDVEGISWYRAKSSPNYVNQNGFFLYIGKKDGGDPYFRFVIQYYGDEWLFIDSYVINVDGVKYEINPDYGDIERDNDTNVWEWYDANPSDSDLAMLQAISKSKRTVVRMSGDQYYKDVVVNSTQKQALRTMFTVYLGLGGSLPTL